MMICRVRNKTSALGTLSTAPPASTADFNIGAEAQFSNAISKAGQLADKTHDNAGNAGNAGNANFT